jgi:hypothetical protein
MAGHEPVPGASDGPGQPVVAADVARLPAPNAIAAVVVAIVALLAAVAVLLLMPDGLELEALGTAATISGSGFTLAARLAVPRRH